MQHGQFPFSDLEGIRKCRFAAEEAVAAEEDLDVEVIRAEDVVQFRIVGNRDLDDRLILVDNASHGAFRQVGVDGHVVSGDIAEHRVFGVGVDIVANLDGNRLIAPAGGLSHRDDNLGGIISGDFNGLCKRGVEVEPCVVLLNLDVLQGFHNVITRVEDGHRLAEGQRQLAVICKDAFRIDADIAFSGEQDRFRTVVGRGADGCTLVQNIAVEILQAFAGSDVQRQCRTSIIACIFRKGEIHAVVVDDVFDDFVLQVVIRDIFVLEAEAPCGQDAAAHGPLGSGVAVGRANIPSHRGVVDIFGEIDAHSVNITVVVLIEDIDFFRAVQRNHRIIAFDIDAFDYRLRIAFVHRFIDFLVVDPDEFEAVPDAVAVRVAEVCIRQFDALITEVGRPGVVAAVPDAGLDIALVGVFANPDVFAIIPHAVGVAVMEEEVGGLDGGGFIVFGIGEPHAVVDDLRGDRVAGCRIVDIVIGVFRSGRVNTEVNRIAGPIQESAFGITIDHDDGDLAGRAADIGITQRQGDGLVVAGKRRLRNRQSVAVGVVSELPDGGIIKHAGTEGFIKDQCDGVDVTVAVGIGDDWRGGQGREAAVNGDGASRQRGALVQRLVEDNIVIVDNNLELIAIVDLLLVVGRDGRLDNNEEVIDAIDVVVRDFVVGGGGELDDVVRRVGGKRRSGRQLHELVNVRIEDSVSIEIAPQLDAGILIRRQGAEVIHREVADVHEADSQAGKNNIRRTAASDVETGDGRDGLQSLVVGSRSRFAVPADAAILVHTDSPCEVGRDKRIGGGQEDGIALFEGGGIISALAELHIVHRQEAVKITGGNFFIPVLAVCGIEDDLVIIDLGGVFLECGGGRCVIGRHSTGDDDVFAVNIAATIGHHVDEVEVKALGQSFREVGGDRRSIDETGAGADAGGGTALTGRDVVVTINQQRHPRERVLVVRIMEDGVALGIDAVAVLIPEGESGSGGEFNDAERNIAVAVDEFAVVGDGFVQVILSVGVGVVVLEALTGKIRQLGADGDFFVRSAAFADDQRVFHEEGGGIEGNRDAVRATAQNVGAGLCGVDHHRVAVPRQVVGIGVDIVTDLDIVVGAGDTGANLVDNETGRRRDHGGIQQIRVFAVDGRAEDVSDHRGGGGTFTCIIDDGVGFHAGIEGNAVRQRAGELHIDEVVFDIVLSLRDGTVSATGFGTQDIGPGAMFTIVGEQFDRARDNIAVGGDELDAAVGGTGGVHRREGGVRMECGAFGSDNRDGDSGHINGLAADGRAKEVVDGGQTNCCVGVDGLSFGGLLLEDSVRDACADDIT